MRRPCATLLEPAVAALVAELAAALVAPPAARPLARFASAGAAPAGHAEEDEDEEAAAAETPQPLSFPAFRLPPAERLLPFPPPTAATPATGILLLPDRRSADVGSAADCGDAAALATAGGSSGSAPDGSRSPFSGLSFALDA